MPYPVISLDIPVYGKVYTSDAILDVFKHATVVDIGIRKVFNSTILSVLLILNVL